MKSFIYIHICLLLFIMVLFISCGAQERAKIIPGTPNTETVQLPWELPKEQIAEYVRNIIEDKNGGLWFGTNGYGVVHYDGDSVTYFSNDVGFNGRQVTGITEDKEQNLWFATDQGIVQYDWSSNDEGGKQFINYTDPKYFDDQRFWSVFADSKGTVWAGGVSGIIRQEGSNWAPFSLPYPEKITGEFITKATSWGITEDKAGNMWFSTNGFGAYKFSVDGTFAQYSEKDGLSDNSVDHILEDSKGNIWFGTRNKGVSKFDGQVFTNYTQKNSIGNNEVCEVYEDKMGNIWFSSEGFGVYRLDPLIAYLPPSRKSFTNYAEDEGLGVRAVQAIYEDSKGRLWVGGGGGLYRLDKSSNRFINVGKNGPWK